MSPCKIVLMVTLLILLTGFGVDLMLARRYYRVKRHINGWAAIRNWAQRRAWFLGGAAALYLGFMVLLLNIDLTHFSGLRYGINRFLVSARIGPRKISLLVALILLSCFIVDLLFALKLYDAKRSIKGWVAIRRWAGRRAWFLGGAAALYLTFVGMLFFTDLLSLPGWSSESNSLEVSDHMSPDKVVLIMALMLMVGVCVDLMRARGYYDARRNLGGWAAIRRWAQRRSLILGGVTAIYLMFAWVLLCTDLIHLPGLRYESKRFVVSANKYLKQRKYREAILELRNALGKNPEDHEIRLTLARTLHMLGRYPEAEVEYRAVLAAATVSYDARLGLARLLLVTTRKDAAMNELREAIRLQPNAAEPHLLLARILRIDGDFSHAVEESRVALMVNPDHPDAREQYITTAIEGRFFTDALREAAAGHRKYPADIKLLGYQALALQGLGRFDEADTLLREAAAGDPQAAHPWLFMGDLLLLRKEYQAALKCYEEGLKRDPKNIKVMNNIASLTTERGFDLKRAHQLAAYLNWKYPNNPAYADTLGWVLVKQGEAELSMPYLRQAVVGAPQNPEHRYHLGAALLSTGYREQGRKELEAALRLGTDFDGAPRARTLLER